MVEFTKLKTAITRNIYLEILNQMIYILHNIDAIIIILLLWCDWCEINFICYMLGNIQ